MRKYITILVLITALAIAGCATGTYHPTKPRSEWANDHKDCERKARDIAREEPDLYGEDVDRDFVVNYRSDEQRMVKDCMRRKGWTSKEKSRQ
ncbi:MAG: hypothetical protein N2F24_05275 [Deltaproteobacteria bacterium]|jgi:hypothetical protein